MCVRGGGGHERDVFWVWVYSKILLLSRLVHGAASKALLLFLAGHCCQDPGSCSEGHPGHTHAHTHTHTRSTKLLHNTLKALPFFPACRTLLPRPWQLLKRPPTRPTQGQLMQSRPLLRASWLTCAASSWNQELPLR
jgi:hypothetical protein